MQNIEPHPLQPFLPENCRVLFMGSFPPPRKRWCVDFFYPNYINDHWRIQGLIWFNDKNYFVDAGRKCFRVDLIKAFLNDKGIGYYDTATAVRRLADNASDKFLEIVQPTDIQTLIAPLRDLRTLAVTGEKACETICTYYHLPQMPKVGEYIELPQNGCVENSVGTGNDTNERVWHTLRLYRLPSSSRAYPLSLEKKAEAYRKMFEMVFAE